MRWYGALDLGFAALYAWVGWRLLPLRPPGFDLALGLVCLLLVGAGVGLLAGARWGRPLALAASVTLLGASVTVLWGLVASAAYLRSIYGPLGEGLATLCILFAALVVEAGALLPLFQLRFLLRRAPAA